MSSSPSAEQQTGSAPHATYETAAASVNVEPSTTGGQSARDRRGSQLAAPPPAGSRRGSSAAAAAAFEDGRLTVSVRARPMTRHEHALATTPAEAAARPHALLSEASNCLHFINERTVVIFDTGVPLDFDALPSSEQAALIQRRAHSFTFDHAYGGDTSQQTVYHDIGQPVLEASFLGFNTCIFAYGQTGSGKSFCMMGPEGGRSAESAPGIIPRLCADLFRRIDDRKQDNAAARARQEARRDGAQGGSDGRRTDDAALDTAPSSRVAADTRGADSDAGVSPPELEIHVFVSYLEVYREKVRCLLNPKNSNTNLRVRQHPSLGVYVEGLKEVPVTHEDQVVKLMKAGTESRHTASTMMNDTSSRSHAIFSLQLIQTRKSTTKDGTVKTTELRAKINLVDLAGSERAKATGAEGDTLKEGALINKSLSTLGLVISALAEISTTHHGSGAGQAPKHIPYRDSTLTFLLKESLGGNSKTYMLSTLSPARMYYDETLSTLRYADRAKQIVTRAFVNETAGDKRIRELEDEVTRLRETIKQLTLLQALPQPQQAQRDPEENGEKQQHPQQLHQDPTQDLVPRSVDGEGSADASATATAQGPPPLSPSVSPGRRARPVLQLPSRRDSESYVYDESLMASANASVAQLTPMRSASAEPLAPVADFVQEQRTRAGASSASSQLSCDEDIDLSPGKDAVGDGFEARISPDPAPAGTALHHSPAAEQLSRELNGSSSATVHGAEFASSPTDAGASAPVELVERAEDASAEQGTPVSAGGAAAAVETLQSELRRAEEVIRQLTATDTERDQEVDHVLAEVNSHSTVKLSRGAPYLMNLDGVGDWLVMYLAAPVVCIGAERPTGTLKPAPGDGEGEASGTDHRSRSSNSSDAMDADESLVDSSSGDDNELSSEEQYVVVRLCDADVGFALGSPHCRFKTIDGCVWLLPCRGSASTEPHPLFMNGSVIPVQEACQLHSGDVLTLGELMTGPQFKYIDPSAPAASASAGAGRARRGRVGAADTPSPPPASAGAVASPPALADCAAGEGGNEVDYEDGIDSCRASADDGFSSTPLSSAVGAGPPLVPSLSLGALAKRVPTASPAGSAGAPPGLHDTVPAPHNNAAATAEEGADSFFPDGARESAMGESVRGSHPLTVGAVVADGDTRCGEPTRGRVVVTAPAGSGAQGSVRDVFGGVPDARVSALAASDSANRPAHFVGRHTLLFLGPSGAGKTCTRENLRRPDERWFDFLSKRGGVTSTVLPTWGVDRSFVEVDGGGVEAAQMSLSLVELSGRACCALLQDQLPARRVTYVLCFPLTGGARGPGSSTGVSRSPLPAGAAPPSLALFRHTLEYILCQSDHRDAGVVLLGTHMDLCDSGGGGASQGEHGAVAPEQAVYAALGDLEQQVQNYFLLLQPNAELRPTIVGRFAVDNAQRRVYSAGFARVQTFPELLRWFADQGVQRCRNDLDFLNGLVPNSCAVKLAGLVQGLRRGGQWCLSSSDYKARAKALDSCYQNVQTLHLHTQLLSHWGLLIHRFRHAKMRAHVVVDVAWYMRLLSCIACCGAASRDRPDEMMLCTLPIMHSFDQSALLFSPERVILADSYGLLSRGVMTTRVLSVLVQRLLQEPPESASPRSAADERAAARAAGRARHRPSLLGVLALLQTCDYVIPGRKLLFSPAPRSAPTSPSAVCAMSSPSSPMVGGASGGSAGAGAGRGLFAKSEASLSAYESFLLLPSTFHDVAQPAVVQHTAALLTGPFYRFTFSMVPPFFFAKLCCRLANDVGESVYAGPVRRWLVEADGPSFPLFVGDADEPTRGAGAAEPEGRHSSPPTGSPDSRPRAATVPGEQRFWRDAMWVTGEVGGARALLRMVSHSLFVAFSHTESCGATESVFYDEVLQAVRSVVQESPGTRCEESLLHCYPGDGYSESSVAASRSPSASSPTTAAGGGGGGDGWRTEDGRRCFYGAVTDNVNSLEKIREREAYALQTARSQRWRTPQDAAEGGERGRDSRPAAVAEHWEEENAVPYLRSFDDTPLDIGQLSAQVDLTSPMRRDTKTEFESLLAQLHDARERCHDGPHDDGDRAVETARACGLALDRAVDALARIK